MIQNKLVYTNRFGLRKYIVSAASGESIEKWKKQIELVRDAVSTGSSTEIAQAMQSADSTHIAMRSNIDFLEKLDRSSMHDSDFTLIAIGLWVLREKSVWKGNLRAGKKLFAGGNYSMESFVDRNGNATCLDLCLLINELTKAFKIDGGIYKFGGLRFNHRFWMADRSQVLDPMHAWQRSGFFKTVEEFREFLRRERLPFYVRLSAGLGFVREKTRIPSIGQA